MELVNCGMVLEGGAIRGVFTAGVLDYLMEQNFYTKYVVGVSAGACNALDYVSKQIGRTRDCFIPEGKENQYIHLTNLARRKPVYDYDMVFDKFPKEVYPFDFDAFFASGMECEMVLTDCQTGRARYARVRQSRELCLEACRASSSMPFFSDIVEIKGVPYLDGGIADSIPLKRSMDKGFEKNIVILTKNPGYRKKPLSRAMKLALEKNYGEYPEFIDAMKKRPYRYNRRLEQIEQLAQEGKIFLICPQEPMISKLERNREKQLRVYEHGYEMMQENYEKLLEYVAE